MLATWMATLAPLLTNVTLLDLSLPGAHDAMTYDLSDTLSDGYEGMGKFVSSILHTVTPVVAGNFIRAQGQTQGTDVIGMLDGGVRFIDFRVMYTEPPDTVLHSKDWYCLHGTMSDKDASLSSSVTPRSGDRSEDSPSVASLQSLQQILKDGKSLSGRKVMVPLTRQAFMEGHLQPQPTDGGVIAATESQSISEEKVLANLGGGQLAEMSRADAAAFIQRRIDAVTSQSSAPKMSAAKSSASTGKKNKQPKKSALKVSSKQSAKSQAQPQPHTILPFFEIREEYDSSGQEVKAEAVNVANEMKALKDALRSQNTGAGGDGEDAKQIRELIGTIDIGGGDDGGDVGQQQASGDDGAEDEAMYDEEPEQQEPVSDEQYDSLSARLDELAKMEEEAEKNKNEGQSSRHRLQGKAWGKGFLSSNGSGAAAHSQKQKAKTGKKKKSGGASGG